MIQNKFVAIDLGSTHISVMAGEVLENGFLRILGLESKPADDIKYGIVEQSSGAAFKLNELIRMLENSARLKDIDYISVSVGAKSMKNIQVSVSHFIGASKIVSEKLINDMNEEAENKIKGENVAIYDVFPLWYDIDGQKFDDPVGKQGTQIIGKYNIVYGNKLIAEKLEGCLERTGKIIEHRCLAVEALATAVLDNHEKEEGCILINLGGLTSTLSIFEQGTLQQMVVIPLGSQTITKDIQEFGISEKNAERLKCAVGKALETQITDEIMIAVPSIDPDEPQIKVSSKILAMAIEARLDEILNPIFDAIEAYTGNLSHGIVLTGGGSQLNGINEYITERTGFKVRYGTYTDWLAEKTDPKYDQPIFAQLVGTILLNQEYRQHHPLIDTEKIKQKKKSVKLPGSGLKTKTTELFKNFFEDDNKLQ
ncbi:MAG: cell division protein FtsA [Paludibacter sp.]|nr:cell division protein FtsA [Paludibacter sp.]